MVIIKQMLVLFVMMLMGLIAYKKKIITSSSNKALSGLVVNIANPALVLSSAVGGYDQIDSRELVLTVISALIMYGILIALSFFVPKLLKAKPHEMGTYNIMTIFTNVGFMGFPVISSIYGREALLYASIFLLPYNLLIYTYGIRQMSQNQPREKVSIGKILNVGVIASILAIALFAFKIEISGWVGDSILMLSNLTAPLSMMIIGVSFGEINMRELVQDKRLLVFSLIKQFILPVIVGWMMLQIIPSPLIAGITVLMLAVPVGSMCALLAQAYDRDYELVSKGVVLTTILSIISIPVITMILL